MIDIQVKCGSGLNETCDLLVVGVFKKIKALDEFTEKVNVASGHVIDDMMKEEGFEGDVAEWLIFPTFGKLKAKKLAVIGLGERAAFTIDTARKIGASIIKRAREAKAKNVWTMLHGVGVNGFTTRDVAAAFGEGVWLGSYHFHAYKEKERKEASKKEVATLTVAIDDRGKVVQTERGFARARLLAEATMFARDLVNTPSAEMTPAKMAEVAKEIAKRDKRISLKIFDQTKMESMGMRAALAVARGSQHSPYGIHLVFRPSSKPKRRIAIVGKAVTFDSGGLSIKPSEGMTTMKIDMAGAAAVLGLFRALPSLEVDTEVHGIFLAVENMPSGTAYRPGDVVKAKNGVTIEILNTDAEGRVTLADALSYAAELKPDEIVDLATLTGACVVALGEEISGLMANDRKLAARLLLAASKAGEELWELPLFQSYQEHIKSRVADIKNTGARGQAGTISAALFLSHFVGKIPWAHLDIAGPSYAEKETRPDVPFGGTGCGVRLLATYLEHFT